MKEKYAFCGIMLIITILANKFIVDSFSNFYRFDIEETIKTTGTLTKAYLYEGIGTTEYQCDIIFNHNGTAYNFSDDISYRSNMHYKKGDSINVVFNKSNPQWATINGSEARYFMLFCSVFLVASSIYSIVFLSKTILSFISKKTIKS
jgi:hypothetical protein